MSTTLKMICLSLLMGCSMAALGQGNGLQAQCVQYEVDAQTGWPMFVRFRPEAMPAEAAMMATLHKAYGFVGNADQFRITKTTTDALGFTHLTLQHTHLGYPVFASVLKAHLRAGKMESFNGRLLPVSTSNARVLDESAALAAALQTWGAQSYKWQIAGEETVLQRAKNDPQASFYPQGELMYVQNRGLQSASATRLAWRFDIYAHAPTGHAEVFVDAETGETIYRNELMHTTDVTGVATTRYSGVQTIYTDSTGPGAYRLRETVHGQGIETYNMHNGTNYANATDFTDSDNVWNTTTPLIDRAATDAHWGAEMTSEFYQVKLGRNSYDDNGGKFMSYVHYDNGLFNANWNGFVMSYGDGGGNMVPFTTLDICGHELTHGVTQYAASLIYQDEAGALNESFSDIFGNSIERYARPSQNSWLIAEDFGAFRSMSNPNQYQNPDTYLGTFWATGTADNGGVHTNSGVQNYWYYLLVDGGAGTNDNGDAFVVQGLGLDTAAAIAYRNLNTYMTANSDYRAARFGAIQAAIDLFGECSNEMIQTWNAWAAVGLGTPFTSNLAAGFYSPDTNMCALPFIAHFTNTSSGGIHFLWQFGDGGTSTQENPNHAYAFTGTYSVTLIAYGCNGAIDTLAFPNRIVIDVNQTCPINMPSGIDNITSNACDGILYDAGGGGNYLDNTNSTISIIPGSGQQVRLMFQAFNYAAGDRVTIYDGPNVSSPLIGVYAGTSLPPDAVSTNGALTLKESTNGANNRQGFEATWSCFVGMAPQLEAGLVLSPNPSAGHVRLDWALGIADDYVVRVYDLQGKHLRTVTGHHDGGMHVALDLADLSAGVYGVQVQTAGIVTTRRVVLE